MDKQKHFFHPRENSCLFGHDDAENTLLDAISAGRLHHSLLITGPKGIGKATFAYRLARHLFKPEEADGLFGPPEPATSFDMPEEDLVFRQVAAGGHPSLKVLERQKNPETGKIPRDITVADIRGLSDFYRMTSAVGNWRVSIIDAADDMNANAANSLLKILEEPPERSVIILLSHAPGRLLATNRSRCYTVPLETLTSDEL
ncbi:MAG: DNA polymerase III subunit delta', partial [Pseudomonadota bacterium]|nr:DNA polymerase III subunit delta' [Pseudomonadota bacterium]